MCTELFRFCSKYLEFARITRRNLNKTWVWENRAVEVRQSRIPKGRIGFVILRYYLHKGKRMCTTSLNGSPFSNSVKDEKDTAPNFSVNARAATSEVIAQQVQSRMCAKNFKKRLIKTSGKKTTADEGDFWSEHICKEMRDFGVESFISLARFLQKNALCIQGAPSAAAIRRYSLLCSLIHASFKIHGNATRDSNRRAQIWSLRPVHLMLSHYRHN
ncbi:hypothetical protein CSKR_109747 [Clonorchis sinensis]|uniref:Uncharacterized protein n=1 Tax=Clonorchis sinensis TaxID=79923 RepID=A0A419QDK8_CLOSI|nr:hypothetical protein CSKR_109747 [Clonorchis sinensis]